MTRILSLDDAPDVLSMIHLVLKGSGYEHFHRTDSYEALSVLKRNQVDLVTQDWSRPDMDGLEFYQRMKAVESLYDIPVLVMTASDALMSSATIELLRLGRHNLRVRGFQVAPPDRQPALRHLAERSGLQIAYVDGYLSKPCTAEELIREVGRVLKERSIALPTEEDQLQARSRGYNPGARIVGHKGQKIHYIMKEGVSRT